MRYFFDTEFIEDGITIDLISISIVAEDGREYYRQSATCLFKRASDWVWRNVYPHLIHFNMGGVRECVGINGTDPLTTRRISSCGPDCPWRERYEIRDEIRKFLDVEKYGKPEMWGYYADYDWVAFCQLFGTMIELPKGFPMWCRDIKQLCVSVGDPKLPDSGVHNALNDARHVQKMYNFLMRLTADPS